MIRFAQVVAVHSARRTLDIAFSDTGEPVAEVSVLSATVSSDAGVWDIPDVAKPSTEASAGGVGGGGRVIIAAVDFTSDGRPVVVGFARAYGSQMVFSEPNREVRRHPSGAYTTIAPDGSIEHYHPGGAYLRIGAGGHQDLAPVAGGGNWSIPAADPPQITLVTAGFTLTVTPGGETTVTSEGAATLNWAGNVTLQAGGDLNLVAGGALNLSSKSETSWTSPGPVTIRGSTIDLNP